MTQEKWKVEKSMATGKIFIFNYENASKYGLFPEDIIDYHKNFRDADIVCAYLNRGMSLKEARAEWKRLIF